MINVNSYKLIIVVYMPRYLVLLILEFLPARLATVPYGLDANVTKLLANMLTKPSVFYCLPIVPCNLVSIKLLLLLLLYNPPTEPMGKGDTSIIILQFSMNYQRNKTRSLTTNCRN